MKTLERGWCCGVAHDIGIDDVGFVLQMIEQISARLINDSKIYASGHSNGCAMTQKLANEASHVFAGGCMALYLLEDADLHLVSHQSLKFMEFSMLLFLILTHIVRLSSLIIRWLEMREQ